MTYRLVFASSLTVAMIRSCCGSAVIPSHLPFNCQLLSNWPLLEYRAMVLNRFPLPAGSPFGPTPFCQETKIDPPIEVMSSGLLRVVLPAANTEVVNPVLEEPSSLAVAGAA